MNILKLLSEQVKYNGEYMTYREAVRDILVSKEIYVDGKFMDDNMEETKLSNKKLSIKAAINVISWLEYQESEDEE